MTWLGSILLKIKPPSFIFKSFYITNRENLQKHGKKKKKSQAFNKHLRDLRIASTIIKDNEFLTNLLMSIIIHKYF